MALPTLTPEQRTQALAKAAEFLSVVVRPQQAEATTTAGG